MVSGASHMHELLVGKSIFTLGISCIPAQIEQHFRLRTSIHEGEGADHTIS